MLIRTLSLGLACAALVTIAGCRHSTSQRVSSCPPPACPPTVVQSAPVQAAPCCPTPGVAAIAAPPTTIPPPPGVIR